MRALLVVVAILVATPVYALNFKATTRADHKSLDCMKRRLEAAKSGMSDSQEKTDIIATLHHVNPMLTRHGGVIKYGAVELGSEDEANLICTQHGYANTSVNRKDVMSEISNWLIRWLASKIWTVMVACIPWAVVAAVLYFRGKKLAQALVGSEEEHVALRKKIDEEFPDKEVRKAKFGGDPVADRGHERLKAEGKL